MDSISTRADELIIQADLELLYSILDEFVEIGKLFEDSKEMAVLTYKLNRFCDLHKIRCQDLMILKKKVDEARNAYQSLKLKYDGQKDLADHYKKAYYETIEKI